MRLVTLVLVGGLLLASLFLLGNGCKRGEDDPLAPPSSSLINDPAQQDIVEAWTGSNHADTYVLNPDGVNNSCARCHSPLNWLPTEKADLPQSCQSCIVPFELAEPDESVVEADWRSVECDMCHVIVKKGDSGTADAGSTATSLVDADQDFLTTVTVGMYVENITDDSYAQVVAVVDDETITTTALYAHTEDGDTSDLTWAVDDVYKIGHTSATPTVSWLDMLKTKPGDPPVYGEVSSNTELCEQCHRDSGTALYARDLDPDHADAQCTDCHDAHSLERSCVDTDCHTEPITGTVHG